MTTNHAELDAMGVSRLLLDTAKALERSKDYDCPYTVMEEVHTPLALEAIKRFCDFVGAPAEDGVAERLWHWYDSTRPADDEDGGVGMSNRLYQRWWKNRHREVAALLRDCAAIQEART